MKKAIAILLSLVMMGMLAGCGGPPAVTNENYWIALITENQTDPRWLEMEDGAAKAGSELAVQVFQLSPAAEGEENNGEQHFADQVHEAISGGYHAIVAAPDGTEAVSAALQDAVDAGLKLIYVDSSAEAEAAAAFATDFRAAGKAAGEAMLDALTARRITEGEIGMIGADADDASAAELEAGFREVLESREYVLTETQYDAGDADEALRIAAEYIDQEVVGIFGSSGCSAAGAGRAVQTAGVRTAVVGFGRPTEMMDLVKEGHIRAMVNENYQAMGYEGVKAAVSALKGEEQNGTVTDSGVTVVESEVPAAGNSDYTIALIAVDSVERHWIKLEEGALKAAEELGCEVINMSPSIRDSEQQIDQIYNAAESGCHAIIFAADDPDAAAAALEEAADAGVKIICVDSPVTVEADAVFYTDNRSAGRVAAETMIAALEELEITEGSVGIVNVNEETEYAFEREEGFREVFEDTEYTLLETQYSEGDAAKSHTISESYIAQDAVGIFCCSDGCTSGAGNAVRAKKADVVVIGFDVSEAILEMIEEGCIYATIAQNPDVMGYESVKAACDILNGRDLNEAATDCGVSVLTQQESED